MLYKSNLFIIDKIVIENELVKTFWLKPFKKISYSKPKPGQYIMLWLTDYYSSVTRYNGKTLRTSKETIIDKKTFEISDHIPMSISDYNKKEIAITVKNLGPTTKEFHKYTEGCLVGVMGPLGNYFKFLGKHVLIVAGGMGIAPLSFLIKEMKNKKMKIDLLMGVKTKDEILLINNIKSYCNSVNITSDDGSYGHKGLVSDLISEIFDDHDQIYTCGPEKMMKHVLDFSVEKNIPAQFSLERFMHCGMGICGFCSLDGYLVCQKGHILNSKILKDIKDFGSIRKNASGCSETL